MSNSKRDQASFLLGKTHFSVYDVIIRTQLSVSKSEQKMGRTNDVCVCVH